MRIVIILIIPTINMKNLVCVHMYVCMSHKFSLPVFFSFYFWVLFTSMTKSIPKYIFGCDHVGSQECFNTSEWEAMLFLLRDPSL